MKKIDQGDISLIFCILQVVLYLGGSFWILEGLFGCLIFGNVFLKNQNGNILVGQKADENFPGSVFWEVFLYFRVSFWDFGFFGKVFVIKMVIFRGCWNADEN